MTLDQYIIGVKPEVHKANMTCINLLFHALSIYALHIHNHN